MQSFQDRHFEDALVQINHRIDNLLRMAVHSRELRRLAGREEDETEDKEVLQAKIKDKMGDAQDNGSLSKDDAVELMMMMMKLKKMNVGAGEGESSSQNGIFTDAGCTSVVAYIEGRHVYVANAGDSRAVICTNGVASPLSYDHKPTHEKELKRITDAGGTVNAQGRVNGNLNLSRCIGDLKYKVDATLGPEAQIITAEPDVLHHLLTPEDEFIVLACDGIWDVKTNQEVCDFVKERLQRDPDALLSRIAEELMDDCIADDPKKTMGIGGDNMTAMIVRLRHGWVNSSSYKSERAGTILKLSRVPCALTSWMETRAAELKIKKK